MIKSVLRCNGSSPYSFICRVKELGPGGPIEGRPADIVEMEDESHSQQSNDLAMLRSANVSLTFY
jgi:hypothetical protein